jgi:hypothetical protein
MWVSMGSGVVEVAAMIAPIRRARMSYGA